MALGGIAVGRSGYTGYDYESSKTKNRSHAGNEDGMNLTKPAAAEAEEVQEKPLSEMSRQDMIDYIRQRSQIILEKLQKGDTETKIQIGGAEFSEDEWDKTLRRVDEAIRQMQEENEKDLEEETAIKTETESENLMMLQNPLKKGAGD